MGFQSLKVQKGATEIYNHLKTITTRFGKHFDNIIILRKKLEEAMSVVDKFGTDARSISRTLENIKDPEQVEKAVLTENVEKFVERNKQFKINFFFPIIPIIRNLMHWNNKYIYPKSTRSIFQGSRHYSVNQENLPSVTTILKATESEEKKAKLEEWKKRVGYKQAEVISKEATSRGSSMHDYLEKFLLGKLNMDLLGDNTREKMMADQIIENGLRDKLSEIWGCEVTLYYPGKYAGAADCIGIYENKETIIDFKQSNKPKKDEWIDDYYLQCAAYSLAHNKVHGSNITQAAILLCTKDNIFQRFIVEGERLINYQNQFLEKVEQFLFTKDSKLNYVVWDIETDSAQFDWATMIEVGAILLDENFIEKERFTARCRMPQDRVPSATALCINKSNVDLITKGNLSHYQMIAQVELKIP